MPKRPLITAGLDACESRDLLAIEYAKGRDDGFSREAAADFLAGVGDFARRTGRSFSEAIQLLREDAPALVFGVDQCWR